jgi:hypothetical protein
MEWLVLWSTWHASCDRAYITKEENGEAMLYIFHMSLATSQIGMTYTINTPNVEYTPLRLVRPF